ncbi:hypothetical protein MMC07_002042 [Pseudocyphellaria aurata]|nr:hypothetical protein [Pseudocyphellaria aurata]
MYQYTVPTTGYVRYEYTTSPSTSQSSSPSPAHGYPYYTAQYKTPVASPISRRPSTRHARKESFSTPPKPADWQSPAYSSPEYYAAQDHYASPRGAQPHSSYHGKSRRYTSAGRGGGGDGSRRYAPGELPREHVVIDTSDEADDGPIYTFIKPPRPSQHREKYTKASPQFFYNHEPAYDDTSDSQPQRSRARRSTHPTKPRDSPTKSAKSKAPLKVATAADSLKAGIPAGYSTKNWDPDEAPILLLGSVFDANSLGKWIYDWTVWHHTPNAPIAEVAGDLWLLLIKLAGKMQRADECLDRITGRHNHQLVGDFLASGDRLWGRLSDLLKTCEEYMWKAARKGGKKGSVDMGKHTGCVFVDTIFGRDREMETTEGLMQSIRLWNMRFDANCEDILRHPSARTRRRADT